MLLLAVFLGGAAQADCRRNGVEWIVGGPSPFDCEAPAPVAVAAAARPRVSAADQRARDQERGEILAQELAQEERLLLRNADAANALRIRDNIAALRREMARLEPTSRRQR
ncbi:hypothetical protein [Roseateles sp.]|uniref:hypothetical protein n=1 Tax=Roseateles sp. TaxID=1971397 RepID=UPI0032644F9F